MSNHVIVLRDLHARTAEGSCKVIIRDCIALLEFFSPYVAKHLENELIEVIEADELDRGQWLHELAIEAEELVNSCTPYLAGVMDDGQHWTIEEATK